MSFFFSSEPPIGKQVSDSVYWKQQYGAQCVAYAFNWGSGWCEHPSEVWDSMVDNGYGTINKGSSLNQLTRYIRRFTPFSTRYRSAWFKEELADIFGQGSFVVWGANGHAYCARRIQYSRFLWFDRYSIEVFDPYTGRTDWMPLSRFAPSHFVQVDDLFGHFERDFESPPKGVHSPT